MKRREEGRGKVTLANSLCMCVWTSEYRRMLLGFTIVCIIVVFWI